VAVFFKRKSSAPLSLEQKLDILAACGLRLAASFQVQDLLTSFPLEAFEKPGFDMVLTGLGMTEEQPPWRDHCVNLWHFDTECIKGDGSYVRIAERLKGMAQGSLPIDNIRDQVEEEAGEAWLAFDFQGEEIRIDCEVNSDWVDARVFSHFIRLLDQSDPSKIFLTYSTGGQDAFLACVTNAQFAELKRAGVEFRPLA
jgi:hypothetical protein